MKKTIMDDNNNPVEVEITYNNITVEDIIKWCQENNQIDWLKAEAAKEFPKIDKAGNPILDENGNPIKRKISFIELKKAFAKTHMPEIAPKGKKKVSMYDLIKSL